MALPPVPDWLKLLRAGVLVVSALAMLIHLSVFDNEARDRHLKALEELADSIRDTSARVVVLLSRAAGLARSALLILYGREAGRRLVTSAVLSVAYVVLAGVVIRSTIGPLDAARSEKERLESALNPWMKYTRAQIQRASACVTRRVAPETGECTPIHDDDTSVAIRADLEGFDERWEAAVLEHPRRTELAWLTLTEGHPPDRRPELLPLLELVASNVVLDLLGLTLILVLLKRMSECRSSLELAGWTLTSVVTGCGVGTVALTCATQFLSGANWAYLLLLVAAPMAAAMLVGGSVHVVSFWAARLTRRRGALGELADDRAAVLSGHAAAVGGALWMIHIVNSLRLSWQPLHLATSGSLGPWVLAFACVGPIAWALVVVSAAWLGRLAGGLFLPILSGYLTVSARVNKNVSVGLLAIPAALINAIYAVWDYYAKA